MEHNDELCPWKIIAEERLRQIHLHRANLHESISKYKHHVTFDEPYKCTTCAWTAAEGYGIFKTK